MDETRPDIAADPMFRAPSPEVASESTIADGAEARPVDNERGGAGIDAGLGADAPSVADASAGAAFSPGAGRTNRRSSITGFTVMRSNVYCVLFALELPLGPIPSENGKRTPCT